MIRLILGQLDRNGADVRKQWANPSGTTTRSFVIDDLLPQQIVKEIFTAFPLDGGGFFQRNSFRERKKTSADLGLFVPILTEVTYAMQDLKVVDKIADAVGIQGLEPDPLLYAGGLSMMSQGDFLNPHIDNSHDGARRRFRRLNLLYYVTPEWKEEYGGNFELWNESKTIPKTVVSRCNRLLVMETTATSWHSVSPVRVDQRRCCVSNYFFSKGSLTGKDYFHVTSFLGRPEQKVRRLLGHVDNFARYVAARVLRIGRGRHLINKAAQSRAGAPKQGSD